MAFVQDIIAIKDLNEASACSKGRHVKVRSELMILQRISLILRIVVSRQRFLNEDKR